MQTFADPSSSGNKPKRPNAKIIAAFAGMLAVAVVALGAALSSFH